MSEQSDTTTQAVKVPGQWASKGDKVDRSTDVDLVNRTVTVTRTVKRNATDDQSLVVRWVFDFKGMSEEQMFEMAARQAVIDQQQAFRTTKDKATDWAQKTFTYPIEHERTTKTAFEKVTAAVSGGKLSDEEKAALLRMLQGEEG